MSSSEFYMAYGMQQETFVNSLAAILGVPPLQGGACACIGGDPCPCASLRREFALDIIERAGEFRARKSLAEMMAEVFEFEVSKGWQPNDNQFGTSLALLHSEISEALEAYRDKDWGSTGENGKPEGVSSELADVFIRTLSTWGQFMAPEGFDLEVEYERKMAYNRTRAWRHGGRTV